jgi:hypothetical protein
MMLSWGLGKERHDVSDAPLLLNMTSATVRANCAVSYGISLPAHSQANTQSTAGFRNPARGSLLAILLNSAA